MWQRVQTLYFAIIVALLSALALGTVATIIVPGSEPENVAYMAKLPYAVLIILALLANLVALFCWGHRPLQIRLAGGAGCWRCRSGLRWIISPLTPRWSSVGQSSSRSSR